MEPIIDHIEITVRDISVAVRFYDRLLPLLGFDLSIRSSAQDFASARTSALRGSVTAIQSARARRTDAIGCDRPPPGALREVDQANNRNHSSTRQGTPADYEETI